MGPRRNSPIAGLIPYVGPMRPDSASVLEPLGSDGPGLRHQLVASPVGPLLLVADRGALVEIRFHGDCGRPPAASVAGSAVPIELAKRQLTEYFAGKRRTFELPLAPRGTDFQLAVWLALRGIPYGATTTYGEIAAEVGLPTAARAVGAANGANPLPIVVPCHRVIGASGRLVGFGGGLETKAALLALERGERSLF